ncbi:MAG: hypothetical protein IPN77_21330 [Sandaracinaceae bacterium]|nr:hypothetical protein [Sandaracinaceae bacterium]
MGPRACKLVMGLVVGLTLVTAVGCKGCGSDFVGEGTPDAGECRDCGGPDGGRDTPDGGGVRRDSAVMNPFMEADSLSCMQLDFLWHQQQDLIAADLKGCEHDTDCVLVVTAIDCKPITGDDIRVAGCQSAVAVAHEATWLSDVGALGAFLCAERTLECVSSSLCPGELEARCVSGLCRAL